MLFNVCSIPVLFPNKFCWISRDFITRKILPFLIGNIPDLYWVRCFFPACRDPLHKMTILSKLCILFHLKPAQLEMIHERRHMHTHTHVSCTHVSSCSLIITVRFSYICLRTISAITSRGEKIFQEGGSTVAPRLPEWGGERYCEVKTRVKGVMEEKHHGLQNLSGQVMVADNCYHRTLVAI